jgi:hypothetical protein
MNPSYAVTTTEGFDLVYLDLQYAGLILRLGNILNLLLVSLIIFSRYLKLVDFKSSLLNLENLILHKISLNYRLGLIICNSFHFQGNSHNTLAIIYHSLISSFFGSEEEL